MGLFKSTQLFYDVSGYADGVDVLGQQAIPAILTFCVWWPFVIPQIWGVIKQVKLDNIVMEYIQTEFDRLSGRKVSSKVID